MVFLAHPLDFLASQQMFRIMIFIADKEHGIKMSDGTTRINPTNNRNQSQAYKEPDYCSTTPRPLLHLLEKAVDLSYQLIPSLNTVFPITKLFCELAPLHPESFIERHFHRSAIINGVDLMQCTERAEALTSFCAAATAEESDNETFRGLLGLALYAEHEELPALETAAIKHASETDPSDLEILWNVATHYAGRDKHGYTIDLLDLIEPQLTVNAANAAGIDLSDFYYRRAASYQARGELELALLDAQKSVGATPDSFFANNILASIYFSLENYPAAALAYADALNLEPENLFTGLNCLEAAFLANNRWLATKHSLELSARLGEMSDENRFFYLKLAVPTLYDAGKYSAVLILAKELETEAIKARDSELLTTGLWYQAWAHMRLSDDNSMDHLSAASELFNALNQPASSSFDGVLPNKPDDLSVALLYLFYKQSDEGEDFPSVLVEDIKPENLLSISSTTAIGAMLKPEEILNLFEYAIELNLQLSAQTDDQRIANIYRLQAIQAGILAIKYLNLLENQQCLSDGLAQRRYNLSNRISSVSWDLAYDGKIGLKTAADRKNAFSLAKTAIDLISPILTGSNLLTPLLKGRLQRLLSSKPEEYKAAIELLESARSIMNKKHVRMKQLPIELGLAYTEYGEALIHVDKSRFESEIRTALNTGRDYFNEASWTLPDFNTAEPYLCMLWNSYYMGELLDDYSKAKEEIADTIKITDAYGTKYQRAEVRRVATWILSHHAFQRVTNTKNFEDAKKTLPEIVPLLDLAQQLSSDSFSTHDILFNYEFVYYLLGRTYDEDRIQRECEKPIMDPSKIAPQPAQSRDYYVKAFEYIARLEETKADPREIRRLKGWVSLRLGEPDEAIVHFEEALNKGSQKKADILGGLAMALKLKARLYSLPPAERNKTLLKIAELRLERARMTKGTNEISDLKLALDDAVSFANANGRREESDAGNEQLMKLIEGAKGLGVLITFSTSNN